MSKGRRSQLSKACLKLEAFVPEYRGFCVDFLYASLKDHLRILEACERGGEKSSEIPDRPRIQLSSGNYLIIS